MFGNMRRPGIPIAKNSATESAGPLLVGRWRFSFPLQNRFFGKQGIMYVLQVLGEMVPPLKSPLLGISLEALRNPAANLRMCIDRVGVIAKGTNDDVRGKTKGIQNAIRHTSPSCSQMREMLGFFVSFPCFARVRLAAKCAVEPWG